MLFKSLSKREKNILYFAIAIIAGSVLYGYAIEPTTRKWHRLKEEILVKEIKLKKDYKMILKHSKITEEFKKRVSAVTRTGSDEKEMAVLLQEIEALTRKSGIDVNALRPRAIQDLELHQRFTVEIDLDATMEQLVNFMYQIQNSDKILKVSKLEINVKPQQDLVKCYIQISRVLLTN